MVKKQHESTHLIDLFQLAVRDLTTGAACRQFTSLLILTYLLTTAIKTEQGPITLQECNLLLKPVALNTVTRSRCQFGGWCSKQVKVWRRRTSQQLSQQAWTDRAKWLRDSCCQVALKKTMVRKNNNNNQKKTTLLSPSWTPYRTCGTRRVTRELRCHLERWNALVINVQPSSSSVDVSWSGAVPTFLYRAPSSKCGPWVGVMCEFWPKKWIKIIIIIIINHSPMP